MTMSNIDVKQTAYRIACCINEDGYLVVRYVKEMRPFSLTKYKINARLWTKKSQAARARHSVFIKGEIKWAQVEKIE